MGKVLGIGGVFFKATDREALRDWYQRVLGFEVTKWGGVVFPPLPRGATVWSPFAEDTAHFEPSRQPYMINLVVDDLDGVLSQVAAAGVDVLDGPTADPQGRFAWIMDPAGVKLELWEPAEA